MHKKPSSEMCKYPLVVQQMHIKLLDMEYTSTEGGWWDRIPSSSLCKHLCVCAMWYQVGLDNSMIVIHCRDNWSTIVMMLVLFYYHDSGGHGIE